MTTYEVKISAVADAEIKLLQKSEIKSYNKIFTFVEELKRHPRTGTGKPELMKYGKFKGLWSRRITDKHRLVYDIKDKEVVVYVLTAKGHYDDK